MPAPTITTITPPDGLPAGGTEVLVYGDFLTSVVAVTFGATPATAYTIYSINYLTATSPPGSGTVELTVTDALANTASLPFTYTIPPTISSISPSTGTTAGGTVVYVTGTSINSVVAVEFGTTPATFAVISPTQLRTTSPPGSGTVELTIFDAFGNTADISYTYIFVPGNLFGVATLHSNSAITATATVTLTTMFGAATLQSNSVITATGISTLTTLNGIAALRSNSVITTIGNEIFEAVATAISHTVMTARGNESYLAVASLIIASHISAISKNVIPGKASLNLLSVINATGVRIDSIKGKGGAIAGGAAIIATPVIFYVPAIDDTYINFLGTAPAQQEWGVTGSGTINFIGEATVQLGSRYVAHGDILFLGQTKEPSVVFVAGYGFTWQLNQSATATFSFVWDTGTQRQYWYRVLGQPRTDTCLGIDNCCKQLLMTIQATSVSEVCSKIQSQFGLWPIQSIQRFTRPAETAAINADAANGIIYDCNAVEDIPFCGVPICAALCVEYSVQEYCGFQDTVTIVPVLFTQSLSLPQTHKAAGGIKFTNVTNVAKNILHIKTLNRNKKIKFSGTAQVKSSNYTYAGNGLFRIRGKTKISATHWEHRGYCFKNVNITKYDISQAGPGTSWHFGDMLTNDLANGSSSMITFSNLQFEPPLDPEAKLSGMILRFERFANGFVKDTEVLTKSGDSVLRTLSSQHNWALAIPTHVNYGSSSDSLGFVSDKPFALSIKIEPTVIRDGLLAQLSRPHIQLIYDVGGKVHLGGSTPVRTNFWKHNAGGNISFRGNAKNKFATRKKPKVPQYPLTFEPIIQAQGVSKSKNLAVRALTVTSIITPMPQASVLTLAPPTTTVNTCLCTSMPLSLTFSHNIATANKLQQFLQRNGITIPAFITIDYNMLNSSWQGNFHYQGYSSAIPNGETWIIVFELQCTNLLGATEIGVNVWRFAIKIIQRNLLTNEALQTRLMVAFLPDLLCGQGKDFRFVLDFDTQMQLAILDPAATIYEMVFYDSIGLFKTPNWITNPTLLVNMTPPVLPIPRYPLFMGSTS